MSKFFKKDLARVRCDSCLDSDLCKEDKNFPCKGALEFTDKIMGIFAKEGYGKIIKCSKFGMACADKNDCEKKYKCDFDDLPCDGDGIMFEIIKIDEVK